MLVICKHFIFTGRASFSWKAIKWVIFFWNISNLVNFLKRHGNSTVVVAFIFENYRKEKPRDCHFTSGKYFLFALFMSSLFHNSDGRGREWGCLNVCLTRSPHVMWFLIFLISNFRILKQAMACSSLRSFLSPGSERKIGLKADQKKSSPKYHDLVLI